MIYNSGVDTESLTDNNGMRIEITIGLIIAPVEYTTKQKSEVIARLFVDI